MNKAKVSLGIILCAIFWISNVYAAPYILSAEFSGNEPKMLDQNPDGDGEMLPYFVVTPITVSQSGSYQFRDAGHAFNSNVSISIHTGTFDPTNPGATEQAVFTEWEDVMLNSGTDYTLVMQPGSDFGIRAFGMTIEGPGDISGDWVHPMPAHFYGTFTGDEVLTNIIPEFVGCANSYHTVIGPIEFKRTGFHYFGSTTDRLDEAVAMPMAIGIYEGPFDPQDPYQNQIAIFPNEGQALLYKGKTYYLVLQPDCDIRTGEWAYVMAPPADEFFWTAYMNGSWSDPATAGQGLVLDVFPDIKAIFAAWFTWDTKAANPNDNSDVANAGTRWLTAFGNYENKNDQAVEMTVYEAKKGLFNQGKVESNDPVGTLTIDMFNLCEGGEFRFNLDSGLSGSSLMKRNANDNLDECVSVDARPGRYQP
jgi:hypothetical protein